MEWARFQPAQRLIYCESQIVTNKKSVFLDFSRFSLLETVTLYFGLIFRGFCFVVRGTFAVSLSYFFPCDRIWLIVGILMVFGWKMLDISVTEFSTHTGADRQCSDTSQAAVRHSMHRDWP